MEVKSLCFIKNCAMEAFVGVELLLQEFLNSALDRGEWSASQSAHFAAGSAPVWSLHFREERNLISAARN